jgi:hypothetical protein
VKKGVLVCELTAWQELLNTPKEVEIRECQIGWVCWMWYLLHRILLHKLWCHFYHMRTGVIGMHDQFSISGAQSEFFAIWIERQESELYSSPRWMWILLARYLPNGNRQNR